MGPSELVRAELDIKRPSKRRVLPPVVTNSYAVYALVLLQQTVVMTAVVVVVADVVISGASMTVACYQHALIVENEWDTVCMSTYDACLQYSTSQTPSFPSYHVGFGQ